MQVVFNDNLVDVEIIRKNNKKKRNDCRINFFPIITRMLCVCVCVCVCMCPVTNGFSNISSFPIFH